VSQAAPRFAEPAAIALREAVRAAHGVEVFAIGDVVEGQVVEVTITCRGQDDRVTALLDRPRPGQVVIHNHPSGDLRPSDADMNLAGLYGEDGVGFVIVDSTVSRDNWVVEPHVRAPVMLSLAEVDEVFDRALPRAMPGWETRAAQRQMAHAVTKALNEDHTLLCEAGTGTGKSLAYLVPAALWARANQARVVISTHTRSLQAQILTTDLPLLRVAGIEVPIEVLEGRSNYLCKRRLELALEDPTHDEESHAAYEELAAWSKATTSGTRSDLTMALHPPLWEAVSSDTDLSLKTQCSHYATCHFYQARRRAAAAQVVIVNHALLLADLHLRAQTGRGVLPKYTRVVLDEAHHIEDVATQVGAARFTSLALRRALLGVLPRRGAQSTGALDRLSRAVGAAEIPRPIIDLVQRAAADAAHHLSALVPNADRVLVDLTGVLDPSSPTRRVDDAWRADGEWATVVKPQLGMLAEAIEHGAALLEAVRLPLERFPLGEAQAQPLLDIARAIRRLTGHAEVLRTFLEADDPDACRWLELVRQRGSDPTTAVCAAPIDVGPTLARLLWNPLRGTVCTSATLSVAGAFDFWKERAGLREAREMVLPSPFDFFRQALLGLPRDLPPPEHPDFLRATARVVVEAVEIAGGGTFVLCTSYRAVEAYGQALTAALPSHLPVLIQGTQPRQALLHRFREHRNAVLVGTDSFWEGVSVKGDGLRLVIIPRLPFRVPTDPLLLSRHERIEQHGGNPFRTYTLPQAVLKVRQGFGRLVRSTSDRGVVLVLDTRLHDRWYGQTFLSALPNAQRFTASWEAVAEELAGFLRR
jgi:ATP-dependent DNA helicase DinG